MAGTASSTESQMSSAPTQAVEKVRDVAEQAKGQTREQIRSQLAERSTQLGEQATSASSAIRRASTQLREEGNERAAGFIDSAADRGERLGEYLRDADGDQLLRDVEEFARTRPWLMVTGSALLGFLGSRFVKASSEGRYKIRGREVGGYPTRSPQPARTTAALPSSTAEAIENPTDLYPAARQSTRGGGRT